MAQMRKVIWKLAMFLTLSILFSKWHHSKQTTEGYLKSTALTTTLIVACEEDAAMSWLERRFPRINISVSRAKNGPEAFAYIDYIVKNYN